MVIPLCVCYFVAFDDARHYNCQLFLTEKHLSILKITNFFVVAQCNYVIFEFLLEVLRAAHKINLSVTTDDE